MRTSLLKITTALFLCNIGWAGEACAKEGACCVTTASEKVAKLLASWKTAAEEAKSQCSEERSKIEAKLGEISKQCPIGSRMGETFAFVKASIDAAVKAEAACSGECPVAKAAAEGKEVASPACEGAKLKMARSKLLGDLAQLVSFTAGAAPAREGACCADEGAKTALTTAAAQPSFCSQKAASIIAMVRKESCDKGAAAILMKEIDGLKCETKAGEIVAAIRAESCDDGAAKIVVKAANEILASVQTTPAKEGACAKAAATTTAAAQPSFCSQKAASIIAMVRKESCDKGAAAILMKEIDGLKCETKAGEIVAAIRAESCDDGAAKIVVKAANEILASVQTTPAKEGACAKAAATTTATAAPVKETACASGQACCSELGAKATALKISWEKAAVELKGMCPQKKQELMASMQEIAGKSKTLVLIPESLMALAEGMVAVDQLTVKMTEWAKANPEALKSITPEAMKAFEDQTALIRETTEVLRKMKATMASCSGPSAEAKTETASNN